MLLFIFFQFLNFILLVRHPKGGGWAKPKNGEAYFWAWVGDAV